MTNERMGGNKKELEEGKEEGGTLMNINA